MRTLVFAAFALLGLAGSALADPLSTVSSVQVTLGAELAKKAADDYGVRDVDRLASELQADVQRELHRTGVLAGGRVELTLIDVRPNRPTFKQLGDRPGLSYESFGTGGLAIEGRAISVDGDVTPIRYTWYETDIHDSRIGGTWADAQHGIDRFVFQLGRGKVYARR
ncbi:hypothetical protein [Phenylobacterium sp.]|uniref:hypothetical protein n=1 Tax=Phenylobacterium sp. TaxID=1871053 RepID=UPI00286D126B|nr:hypothetical protein [Phenylobacterium sp.]